MASGSATWTKQAGVTPTKLILIAVLAVVLIGVLYLQLAPSGKSHPTAVAEAAPSSTATASESTNEAQASGPETSDYDLPKPIRTWRQWQVPELNAVVQYDPFARPAAFPQPKSVAEAAALAQQGEDAAEAAEASQVSRDQQLQELKAQLEELKHQGVHVIIQRRDQFVAIIGDRTIHVGDEINGFKVIGIDADGVRVAHELGQ